MSATFPVGTPVFEVVTAQEVAPDDLITRGHGVDRGHTWFVDGALAGVDL